MDLKDNADMVLQNPNVQSLLGGGHTVAFEQKLQEAQFNVVDADSSQIKAIEMAKAGESFVLQGPPGTGKSQTITNIIAECMGDGKKVLFVSEKLAALDVVYNKLKQAGLEDFCLQLHSHKANKRDFIQELCRTMRLNKSGVSSKASEEEDRLNKSHIILDNYVDVLHRPNDVIGKTLYGLVQEVCACQSSAMLNFFVDGIENKGEEYIKTAVDLIENYAEYTQSIGYDYKTNPWYGYVNEDASYQQKFKTKSSLESLAKKVKNAGVLANRICDEYGINCAKNIDRLELYAKLFALLGSSQYVSGALLDKKVFRVIAERVIKLRTIANDIKAVGQAIKENYNQDIFKLDSTQADLVLKKNSGAFSRLFSKDYKALLGEIKRCNKSGKASYKDALAVIQLLLEYNAKSADFAKAEDVVKQRLSSQYDGINTDWEVLDKELATLKDLLARISDFGNLTQSCDGEYIYSQPPTAAKISCTMFQNSFIALLLLELHKGRHCFHVVDGEPQFLRYGDHHNGNVQRDLHIQQLVQFGDHLLLLAILEDIAAVSVRGAVFVKNLLSLLGEEVRLLLDGVNAPFEPVSQPQAQVPGGQFGQCRDCQDNTFHGRLQNDLLLTDQAVAF